MEGLSQIANDTSMISTKRKRSSSAEAPAQPPPPIRVARAHGGHVHINYLTRQLPDSETLPLVSSDDTIPSLLKIIAEYDGVVSRHESMASNLGAKPLGPMLCKRFERLFDEPPRVLKTHGKEGTTVSWLDVVDFARNKPDQFNLEKMRDGQRVCQFYTKQSRVEITEEDFQLIASGMPQRLIPPQPILEDEDKELGTLEILDRNLAHLVQLADQVSARARQLNHRLKNRRNAILNRREAEAAAAEETASPRYSSDGRTTDFPQSSSQMNGDRRVSASPSGFTAVNARLNDAPSQTNGTGAHAASAAVRNELLSKFTTNSERTAYTPDSDSSRRPSLANLKNQPLASKPKSRSDLDYPTSFLSTGSPGAVPIPSTPSSLLPYNKPSVADRSDDSGPYKAEMVSRMEQLQRGDRIQPPCDRCRRLHMDCQKNLTACIGCTRKHAKCSWKDVVDDELKNYVPPPKPAFGGSGTDEGGGSERGEVVDDQLTPKDPKEGQAVDDAELLGEDDGDSEGDITAPGSSTGVATTLRTREEQQPRPSDPPRSIEPSSQLPSIRQQISDRLSTEGRLSFEKAPASAEHLAPPPTVEQTKREDGYRAPSSSSIPSPPLTSSRQLPPRPPSPSPTTVHPPTTTQTNPTTPPSRDYQRLSPTSNRNGVNPSQHDMKTEQSLPTSTTGSGPPSSSLLPPKPTFPSSSSATGDSSPAAPPTTTSSTTKFTNALPPKPSAITYDSIELWAPKHRAPSIPKVEGGDVNQNHYQSSDHPHHPHHNSHNGETVMKSEEKVSRTHSDHQSHLETMKMKQRRRELDSTAPIASTPAADPSTTATTTTTPTQGHYSPSSSGPTMSASEKPLAVSSSNGSNGAGSSGNGTGWATIQTEGQNGNNTNNNNNNNHNNGNNTYINNHDDRRRGSSSNSLWGGGLGGP